MLNPVDFICNLKTLSSKVEPIIINKNNSQDLSHIAITGANGFLSLYLLKELIQNPLVKKITCFTRDKEKFFKQKEALHLNFNCDKISFIENYDWLESREATSYLETVTQFIHCAAQVHNLKSANQLWSSNVELTERILLAWSQTKHDGNFHLISTLSVFASSSTSVHESNPKAEPLDINNENYHLVGGYAQTKWLSEYLLSQYPNAYIWRLGLLTPSLENTIFRDDEFFPLFLKLMNQLNYLPSIEPCILQDTLVDVSPVNEVAHYMVDNLLQPQKIQHVANSRSLSLFQLIECYQETGKKFEFISIDDWTQYIDCLEISKTSKILLKNAFLRDSFLKNNTKYFNLDLFQSTGYQWSSNLPFSKPNKILLQYTNELKSDSTQQESTS